MTDAPDEPTYRLGVPRFSLSALGVDVPGIVAAVSGALGDQGCNLEDSTMTILQGHFAILLVVTAPDATTSADLETALEPAARQFDLLIVVRSLADRAPSDDDTSDLTESLTIAVHGADRPGIVKAVAGALAEKGGNVVDLSTQLVGPSDRPVYVLTLRAVALEGSYDEVEEAVTRTAGDLGVSCTVRRDDADVL
jgi:glycine cleavage system transcriptional repressor